MIRNGCRQDDTVPLVALGEMRCTFQASPSFHSRQLDDGQCEPVRESSVPAAQGVLLSDSGQFRFMQEQFIRTGCFMMVGTELWDTHECN